MSLLIAHGWRQGGFQQLGTCATTLGRELWVVFGEPPRDLESYAL